MRIGIPRELKPREGRVGLIPAACVELVRGGHEVFIEHGAGEKSGYSDQHFRDVGVGILPIFLAARRSDVVPLTDALEGAETELWLLAHPESRHLRRVAATYTHLAQSIEL